jgi:AraC family transcriptional regulator
MTEIAYGNMEDSGAPAFARDVLVQLIIEASSSFETDRPKARRCIERAVELVRGNLGSAQVGYDAMRRGLSGWHVRQLKAYIEANLGDKIAIADLAARARMSTGHFFRTFRASFGATPQAYIMRQRILRAKRLMRSSNEPLARIAVDCGLCDQAHLSRAFRRIMGVSPTAWRRQVD